MNSTIPILTLPGWLNHYMQSYHPTSNLSERMSFVINAARKNVSHHTGGPFAAAVFDPSGHLLSLGVNLVTSHNNAILHAEIVAIMLAQTKLANFDLGAPGLDEHELVSSSQPCAMCVGATNWSGVKRLVYGATVADATAIGFDEGPVSPRWREDLAQRGIEIIPEIQRQEAVSVLNFYAQNGGPLYNGGAGRRS